MTNRLFALLWLIMISDGVGAALAGRHCFRIRKLCKDKRLFEWFTAFGVGMYLYATAALANIYLSITYQTPRPTEFVIQAIVARLVLFCGIWIIALVLMNGGSPGWVRAGLFWFLDRLGKMNYPTESQVKGKQDGEEGSTTMGTSGR